ncbi:hypothetical protein [Pedobacter sp. NJ-S-72]
MQGGEITVESESGLGSCFTVHLNLALTALPGQGQNDPGDTDLQNAGSNEKSEEKKKNW